MTLWLPWFRGGCLTPWKPLEVHIKERKMWPLVRQAGFLFVMACPYSIVAKSNEERLGGHSWRKMWMDVL